MKQMIGWLLVILTTACATGKEPLTAPPLRHRLSDEPMKEAFVGPGKNENLVRAVKVFQIQCDGITGGPGWGCYRLGLLFATGSGVEQNDVKAAELFLKACHAGEGAGCFHLAEALYDGKGLPRDDAWAAEIYRVLCEDGEGAACANLGVMSYYGHGLEPDTRKASELYRKACHYFGVKNGCYNLGVMYLEGHGLEKDPDNARAFLQKACDRHLQEGCAARQTVK